MSSPLRITHAHGDRITVTEERGGIDLISYVYRPEGLGGPQAVHPSHAHTGR